MNSFEDLLGLIGSRVDEIESGRGLPADLVARLKSEGWFRSLIPTQFGGLETPFREHIKQIQKIAEVDASTAWCINQSAVIGTTSLWLGEGQIREIWAEQDTSVSNGPPFECTIAKEKSGYALNGRWGFSSGCQHATWMCGAARLTDKSGWRLSFFKPEDVEFIDNWRVAGLRGTGSFEFRIVDLALPIERVTDAGQSPTIDSEITRIPSALLFAVSFAALALGVAKGGLDDAIEVAEGKHPRYARLKLKEDPNVHRFLAKAVARWRSVNSYLHATVETAITQVNENGPATEETRAMLRLCGTHVIRECAEVTDLAYKIVGSTGIYQENKIQRRFQDMHVITQHVQAREEHFNLVGRYLISNEYERGPMS
jgi:alkylation response protein AidB-like acyl-CoA dehydrogenase